MTSPAFTARPTSAPNRDWWAYIEKIPLPCEISVWLPYGPPVAWTPRSRPRSRGSACRWPRRCRPRCGRSGSRTPGGCADRRPARSGPPGTGHTKPSVAGGREARGHHRPAAPLGAASWPGGRDPLLLGLHRLVLLTTTLALAGRRHPGPCRLGAPAGRPSPWPAALPRGRPWPRTRAIAAAALLLVDLVAQQLEACLLERELGARRGHLRQGLVVGPRHRVDRRGPVGQLGRRLGGDQQVEVGERAVLVDLTGEVAHPALEVLDLELDLGALLLGADRGAPWPASSSVCAARSASSAAASSARCAAASSARAAGQLGLRPRSGR